MEKRTAVAKPVDDISEAVPRLIRLPQKKSLDRLRRGGRCLVHQPQAATEGDRYETLGRERYPATLSRQGAGRRNCLGCFQVAARKQTPRLNTLTIRVNKFSGSKLFERSLRLSF